MSLEEFSQVLSPRSNLSPYDINMLSSRKMRRRKTDSHIVLCGFKILTARMIGVYGKHY